MAARGSVEAYLKQAGVEFLPPKIGVDMIISEMENGFSDPEVLLMGNVGKLDQENLLKANSKSLIANSKNENTEEKSTSIPSSDLPIANRQPALSEVEGSPIASPDSHFTGSPLNQVPGRSAVFSKEFSLDFDSYLRDHAINGVPYVPGVMGIECFGQAVAFLCKERLPALEEVRFRLPIKLLRQKPVKIRLHAERAGAAGPVVLKIESDFITPQGFKLGDPRVHFTATAPMAATDSLGRAEIPSRVSAGGSTSLTTSGYVQGRDVIYQKYFHGPSYQVLEGISQINTEEVWARYQAPQAPLYNGKEPKHLTFPLLTEAAFQAAGFRDLHFERTMTLPDSIARIQFDPRADIAPATMWVWVKYLSKDPDGKSRYDVKVLDNQGNIWLALTDYRMIPVGAI